MNRPKNQHWVPRFYLRYFATPETYSTKEPQVWIFFKDENDGNESITNIKNICAERYLYSPKDDTGRRSWDLETKLGRLETTLSRFWKELAEGFVNLDNQTIRKGLSLFIATMYLRHPETLKEEVKIYKKLISLFEQAPMRSDGTPNIESIEINGEIFDIDTHGWNKYRSWGTDEHRRFFADQIQYQATYLADILMKKRWSIIYTKFNQFITSDKPVLKQHREKQIFGFGTEGTIIIFPISQRRLLVMDDLHAEPANQYYPLKSGALGAFNYCIWHGGSRFMISGRPIPEVLHEIVTWADFYEAQNI